MCCSTSVGRTGQRTGQGPSAQAGRRVYFESLEPRLVLHPGPIVINELHVDPDVKTGGSNTSALQRGPEPVDLSGTLPPASAIHVPDGHTMPAGVTSWWRRTRGPAEQVPRSALGPFAGSFPTGRGHRAPRRCGVVQDEVDYDIGFPWPSVGDPPGYSIELINPNLDNNLGGSWRLAGHAGEPAAALRARPVEVPQGHAAAASAWHNTGFDDSAWLARPGADRLRREVSDSRRPCSSDMRGSYSTLYFRNTFNVADPAPVGTLQLQARYEAGFNVWINGTLVRTSTSPGDDPAYTAVAKRPPRTARPASPTRCRSALSGARHEHDRRAGPQRRQVAATRHSSTPGSRSRRPRAAPRPARATRRTPPTPPRRSGRSSTRPSSPRPARR